MEIIQNNIICQYRRPPITCTYCCKFDIVITIEGNCYTNCKYSLSSIHEQTKESKGHCSDVCNMDQQHEFTINIHEVHKSGYQPNCTDDNGAMKHEYENINTDNRAAPKYGYCKEQEFTDNIDIEHVLPDSEDGQTSAILPVVHCNSRNKTTSNHGLSEKVAMQMEVMQMVCSLPSVEEVESKKFLLPSRKAPVPKPMTKSQYIRVLKEVIYNTFHEDMRFYDRGGDGRRPDYVPPLDLSFLEENDDHRVVISSTSSDSSYHGLYSDHHNYNGKHCQ